MIATFVQGAALGAFAAGLPVVDGRYVGGTFGWLSTLSVLSGVALCIGYAVLGTAWLIKKCEGPLRDAARKLLPWLLSGLFTAAALIVLDAHVHKLQVLHRWTMRPYLGALPIAAALGTWLLLGGTFRRSDDRPFLMATAIFSAAFAAVAVSFWPYMIPYSLTVDQAVSPLESTRFMFWGAGLVALPLTLAYTLFVYHVFRGKVVATADYE